MRAIPYARVSCRHLQQDGFSIESQLERMREICAEQKWTIPTEYVEYESAYEEGLSRSELNKLLDDLRAKGADILLYFSSDRFTRDVADGVILRRELYKLGIRLFFCHPYLQEVTNENELVNILTDWQSQQYVEKLREASMRGYKTKLEGGAYGQGLAPYGYRVEGEKRSSHLVIIEELAQIVRLIFEWCAYTSRTTASIARELTALGIPTPGELSNRARKRAKGVWSQYAIYKILHQEAYAGTWYGHRIAKGPKKKYYTRPREEWIPITVEPIVSRELWEATQEKLRAKAFIRNERHQYLMSRRLTCQCGYATRAITKHMGTTFEARYYKCQAYTNVNGPCGTPGFRAELVEDAVWGWVERLLNHPVSLLEGYRQAQEELDKQNHHVRHQISLLEEQTQEYARKLERLVDLYLDGGYPKDVLDVRKTEYTDILERLHRQHEVLSRQLQQATITDDDIVTIQAFTQRVRQRLEEIGEIDFETKREVIVALNLRGTLKIEEGVKVIYLHWCMRDIRLPLENNGNTERGGSNDNAKKGIEDATDRGLVYKTVGTRLARAPCRGTSLRATASSAAYRAVCWWSRRANGAARSLLWITRWSKGGTYSQCLAPSSTARALAQTG